MEVSDEELIRQLTEADAVDRTFSMELDVAVSKGLVHSIEGASDVTVELGVDVLNDGTLSETAITIERDSQALPLSGQGTISRQPQLSAQRFLRDIADLLQPSWTAARSRIPS